MWFGDIMAQAINMYDVMDMIIKMLHNNNLSSGAGREAFEIEAKPKIVTISHVFVPILLLLLKYAKIDKQMTLM